MAWARWDTLGREETGVAGKSEEKNDMRSKKNRKGKRQKMKRERNKMGKKEEERTT